MKKRIFIALTIPQHIRDFLLAWQSEHRDIPARWLKSNNFHITLVPPWEETEVTKAVRLLESVQGKPTTVAFSCIETGPQSRNPHLIWARGNSTEELREYRTALHALFQQRLIREDFTMHITIGRLAISDQITPLQESVSFSFLADSISLMESLGNSEYSILATKKLS